MKRRSWLVFPVLLIAMVTYGVAGSDHYKCTKSAQDCLNEMAASLKTSGWIGLEIDKSDDGVLTVKRVVADSPAESAGFKSGDVLVALNGIKYEDKNKDALMAAKKSMAPGKQVAYTVSRDGQEKTITATLAPMPSEVLAQWIGHHMLDHVDATAIAQGK